MQEWDISDFRDGARSEGLRVGLEQIDWSKLTVHSVLIINFSGPCSISVFLFLKVFS